MNIFIFLFYTATFIMSGHLPAASGGAGMPAIHRTFDVRRFGARANGRSDDSKAFMDAWRTACGSSGVVRLVIPAGTYLVGPAKFKGPCKARWITVHIQGALKATTRLSDYSSADWLEFGWVKGLTLMGGTFDGQGALSWPYNNCPKQKNCKVLPTNILFVNNVDTVVKGITSLNSKFFHIGLLNCRNFQGSGITISAPANSPNTDGIHMERSSGVRLSGLNIGTGDDCVSIGQGCSDVVLSRVQCGPGHGISVGSLGRYNGEGDVRGLVIKNSILTGTANGVRIKTWENSPSASAAVNMTFSNIVMKNVGKPILIDQQYCPFKTCDSSAPSRVRISNVNFKKIRGTSTYPEAVTLLCSRGIPCRNVRLEDVSLEYVGGGDGLASRARAAVTATCVNVKPFYSGKQKPPPCR